MNTTCFIVFLKLFFDNSEFSKKYYIKLYFLIIALRFKTVTFKHGFFLIMRLPKSKHGYLSTKFHPYLSRRYRLK